MLKKRIGRIFSLALTAILFGSMLSPAFAAENDYRGAVTGWWDSVLYQLTQDHSSYWWGDAVQSISGLLCQDVCGSSPDGIHHASSVSGGEIVDDDAGSFTYATCTYCHERFKVYASDLQQSYEAQVAELPAAGYQSDGTLTWKIVPDYVYDTAQSASHTILTDRVRVKADSFIGGTGSALGCTTPFLAPIDGSYTLSVVSNILSCEPGGSAVARCNPYNTRYEEPILCFAGDVVLPVSSSRSGCYSEIAFFSPDSSTRVMGVWEGYLILTCAPINFASDTIYNINSRPTSITGDYGIIGDNGQIIKVEGDKIVNETNNTYYNPSTGETTAITDWSYNYEDRSYTVTTEAGDTVTITYGDENVVIKEGDTTYNIYYLVDGAGSENPGPGTCNHQWAETSTTPATCTVPGFRLLTCSLCNETKTETIPAPGHKWTIKQEVKNEYDSSGNQTQEGYTIWECSVCGEQQKTTDGTAPPGGGGSGSGSSGGVFSGIFGLLVDFLGFFWNTFRDFVGEGVKGFLNALMDGTSSIFGLLNPFNWGG